MSFLAEIKRRKVFQVAAVYAVVAWLLIQVVGAVSEPLTLPDWLDTVVIVLLGVGFPVALIIAWAFDLTPEGIKSDSDALPSPVAPQSTAQRFSYISQGLVLLAVGFLVVDQYVLAPRTLIDSAVGLGAPTGPEPNTENRDERLSVTVKRSNVDLGPTTSVDTSGIETNIDLSPDGTRLVYVSRQEGATAVQLFDRPIDRLEAEPISGTLDAYDPFFSPDGEWVAFFTANTDLQLKKVSVRGASPQVLANASLENGGAWANDTIVFSNGSPGSLYRVADSGGTPQLLLAPNPGQSFISPYFADPGGVILFTVRELDGGVARDSIAALSLETNRHVVLISDGFAPSYSPTGHLIFMRENALWAAPIDIENLEVLGPEVPVVQNVQPDPTGRSLYAFSDDGTLIYLPRNDRTAPRRLVWVDRTGGSEPVTMEPRTYERLRLAPNGQEVAFAIQEGSNRDIWIYNFASGNSRRLTFEPTFEDTPLWTTDGQRIVFSSDREGGGLFWKAADGSGQIERLTSSPFGHYPESFSPDGAWLIFREENLQSDLHILSMELDGTSRPLLRTERDEDYSAISPDGRWIAYERDQEVYVQPFPNVEDGEWQVSRDGGNEPLWSPDGRELFFRRSDGGPIMVAAVETEPTFSPGTPRRLLERQSFDAEPTYAISRDGQRFLMIEPSEETGQSQTQLVLVDNWFQELIRLSRRAE